MPHATDDVFPIELRTKILRFLQRGATGRVVLNVKEGNILTFEFVECGRMGDLLDSQKYSSVQSIVK